jgi:hypothetical protein
MNQSPSANKARSASDPGRILDLAGLIGLLGKRLDDPDVHDSFVRMNLGAEPVAHVVGDASIGESRTYFFPGAGVIVCAADYSGAGQRIGQLTLVGKARRVYLDGQEYAVETFRGALPLSLRWGQSRADILRRLGCPAMSNEGISISDRPKTPIQETRDADEFLQAGVIVRLIYSDLYKSPSCLVEIDLQRTIGPGQK